jgi:hypothetical protein
LLAEYFSEDNSSVFYDVGDYPLELRNDIAIVDVDDNVIIAEHEGFQAGKAFGWKQTTHDSNSEKLNEQSPSSSFDNVLPIYSGSSIKEVICCLNHGICSQA